MAKFLSNNLHMLAPGVIFPKNYFLKQILIKIGVRL